MGKIVNGLMEREKAGARKSIFGQSLRSSVEVDDDKTVMEETPSPTEEIKGVSKEEIEDEDGDVTQARRDSLVEDLLSDDDDTIS